MDEGISDLQCTQFLKVLSITSLTVGHGGKRNCYDNTVCESFFHALNTELVLTKWPGKK
jgi:transposase InsO family protein